MNRKLTRALIILTALAVLCSLAFAQGPRVPIKNVAVVETEIDGRSGAAKEMNRAEVGEITNELRRAAVNSLPRGRYSVMTAETVQSMGQAVLAECAEENCVIALGSKIGADFIVRGIISKFQNMFTLTVEMYETDYGMLVATAAPVRTTKLVELLEKTPAVCEAMFKKFLETSSPAPVTQVAPVQQQSAPQASISQTSGSIAAPPVIVTTTTAAPQASAVSQTRPAQQTASQPAVAADSRFSPNIDYGSFTDSRDGRSYRTVRIGGQTWMAENLNYNVNGSVCYGNNSSNCDLYGRLYDWATAMGLSSSCNSRNCASQVQTRHRGICPNGWHVPSDKEWTTLTNFAGGSSTAGKKLKSTSSLWIYNATHVGTDDYGFSALPGGYGYSGGGFNYVGNSGYWWSATESASYASSRNMFYNDSTVSWYNVNVKVKWFSLRCVEDVRP